MVPEFFRVPKKPLPVLVELPYPFTTPPSVCGLGEINPDFAFELEALGSPGAFDFGDQGIVTGDVVCSPSRLSFDISRLRHAFSCTGKGPPGVEQLKDAKAAPGLSRDGAGSGDSWAARHGLCAPAGL